MYLVLKFLFCILSVSVAVSGSVADHLTDPRPSSWIVDPNGYLSENTRFALDNMCKEVSNSNSGEIMIVVVDRSGSDQHRSVATGIFNRFGIGSSQTERGILLYAALEDRASEIILGNGIDDAAQIAISENIMNNIMVPRFKSGYNGDALFYGARACAQQLLGFKIKEISSELPAVTDAGMVDTTVSVAGENYSEQSTRDPNITYVSNVSEHNESFTEKFSRWIQDNTFRNGLFVTLGAILMMIFKFIMRRMPRTCKTCKVKMIKLDEQGDDSHLDAGEIKEEEIKSVDYDIWECPDCKSTKKVRYVNWFKFYSKCPKCHYRTVKTTTTVLQRATTYSTGTEQVTKDCKKCSYHDSYTRTIPKISTTSSSSSSSSSRSSSSGGRSSGGGASGRW